jgi:hypothetical protein
VLTRQPGDVIAGDRRRVGEWLAIMAHELVCDGCRVGGRSARGDPCPSASRPGARTATRRSRTAKPIENVCTARRGCSLHQSDDDARIDPTREKRAYGHVAAESDADGVSSASRAAPRSPPPAWIGFLARIAATSTARAVR